jgi:hypothetical protein
MAHRKKIGAGFSREREISNGNLRMIGGKEFRPRKPVFGNKEEEDPALESESEEENWGWPYRFTDEYIDRVEEIYNLINDNGDYEQARDLFHQYSIGSIFTEDYQRLQNDLRNGMDLDGEEENMIKDLKEMVLDIINELKQFFGKRMRGGKKKK